MHQIVIDGTNKIIKLKRTCKKIFKENYCTKINTRDITLSRSARLLNNDQIIETILVDGDDVHLTLKLLAGPTKIRHQKYMVFIEIDQYNSSVLKLEVNYAPDDLIEYMIDDILDKLDDINEHSLTNDDVQIAYKDTILNPHKYFAEYQVLSGSFVSFNLQDGVFSQENPIGKLLSSCSPYYHTIYLGQRETTDTILLLSLKEHDFEFTSDFTCQNCKNPMDHIITPCCRRVMCLHCINVSLNQHKCELCHKTFNKN